MAKVWSDFFDYVLPDVPNCGQDLATIAIRNATMDFFEATGVYVVTATPIVAIAGTPTYTLAASAGWDVAQVKAAWFNGTAISPTREDSISKAYANWTAQTGAPARFMCEDTNKIRLVPYPDAASAGLLLTMRQTLKPSRDSTGISTDWVFSSWVEVIADGAKARLMMMPAKAWSNPMLGEYFKARYASGLADAIRDVNRSLTRSIPMVQMRPAA